VFTFVSRIHAVIQSTPSHYLYLCSILVLYLRLGLSSGLFIPGFPTKTTHACLFPPARASCPAHLNLLDFVTRIPCLRNTEHEAAHCAISLASCYFLHFRTNFLPQHSIFEKSKPIYSLRVSNQVSYPYKTTGNVYFSMF
jgi:hypothetical protein